MDHAGCPCYFGCEVRITFSTLLVEPVNQIDCINISFSPPSYFFLLVFPPSFPQWRRDNVGHSYFRTTNSRERRPLIEEEADTDEDSEPSPEEQGVYI